MVQLNISVLFHNVAVSPSVSDVSGGPRCEMCHWQCHLVTNTGHWSPVHSLLSHTAEHYCHWCNCHCSLLLTDYWTTLSQHLHSSTGYNTVRGKQSATTIVPVLTIHHCSKVTVYHCIWYIQTDSTLISAFSVSTTTSILVSTARAMQCEWGDVTKATSFWLLFNLSLPT